MGNATRKQIDALRKMGYAVAEEISFEEASRLFDEHKAKQRPAGYTPAAKPAEAKAKVEYHLTPEQVRTNAVEAAQRWYPSIPNSLDDIKAFWQCVHEFEAYLNKV